MIRDRGYTGAGMGTFDIVIGDAAYWENARTNMEDMFVGYLSPDETLATDGCSTRSTRHANTGWGTTPSPSDPRRGISHDQKRARRRP